MKDTELERRVSAILQKLEMLSEADSASIVANDGGGASKPDSSPPPGVRADRDYSKPPPKDRSLFDWYSWHFARAHNDARRRLLCYLAERDYANYIHRKPQPRGKTGPEDEREGMKRIVSWYEGVDAVEVAVLEGISVQHVEKARRVHKRNSKTGRPASPWTTWDDDYRLRAINNRVQAGQSHDKIASELGVSKRTIQRYLSKAA